MLPFKTAVNTGDAYYLVWPDDSAKAAQVRDLLAFLERRMPRLTFPGIRFNGPGQDL
ncbi:hypothetical protein [Burkholderia contaminans]|uniref:hypothetical protein n=1 Tax=Burkholderia contaminans TaxID=488447 RepID=UPI002010D4C5|nr:hypothetical protein [Burkholderia contaminans]